MEPPLIVNPNEMEPPLTVKPKEMEPPLKPDKARKNRIPVRKRFKHVKRHVKQKPVVTITNSISEDSSSTPSSDIDPEFSEFELPPTPTSIELIDHDYCSSPSPTPSSRPSSAQSLMSNLSASLTDLSMNTSMSEMSRTSLFSPIPSEVSSSTPSEVLSPPPVSAEESVLEPEPLPQTIPLTEEVAKSLLLEVRSNLFLMLPENFVPLVSNGCVHVLMVGRREEKATQRQVTVSLTGDVRLQVHGVNYPAQPVLSGVRANQPLSLTNIGYFTDRIVDIVSNLRVLEICAGNDHKEFKEAWPETEQGNIENDVFKECRYKETFRSKKCLLLVDSAHWRCKECTKLTPILRRKLQSINCPEANKFTNNRFLGKKQKDIRLAKKQKTIRLQKQTIDRLQTKMLKMIKEEGVKVDANVSKDLTEILLSASLDPLQSLFLQQQIKYAQCKNKCTMKWHPTLIRLALSIYLKAPGAYKELCDCGFIKLPTSRTLFDYSHVTKIKPGIDESVIEAAAKRATSEEHTHKQYHVVMADEMNISKNLVVLKSTGELIGFKDLDDLDQELKELEAHLDDPEKVLEQELASKVMAFMVKGVSSNLKHVVATYPVTNPSPKQMYLWTWDVIGALERSGIMVIAFVGDGCPVNRAFIKLHTPATITRSGVVFDTVNKHAPDRLLYFFSDVPHLLKTIRNAFFNSRKKTKNNKKSPRLLKKNGEYIVWDTIIRLYLSKKDKTLRKSYKLNAQNVYPDSYSRMKVKSAAEVMSHTVGTDILSQGWTGVSETVEFIYRVNDWFDLLNGAFSTHGVKKNNRRLHPYTLQDVQDFENGAEGSRFQELLDFVAYLDEWKEEVQAGQDATHSRSVMSELGVDLLPDEGSFHELDDSQTGDPSDEEFSSRNLLPHQTMLGIEMSCRSFIHATTFLLKEGVTFINARVFCQDPLEQNFGRQRMAGGGSTNPNLNQFLHKQRGFSTIGELSAANKRGNTEVLDEENVINCEPLPKRKQARQCHSISD
ncbi:uncharacterized protein LOC117653722 [Thrips palmi]|uniref:Uncharacterized protein LOC117653722 n=1 Tax=Thrips palmi TaxID=161013 RepID=A0A6P9ABF0_THRPL|nr:uncharacterized protein LOC117653722 [Thrips palmi]